MKPVLYLDIDDTLLSWASGAPAAVAGSGEFVAWAMEHFDVRWLSRWCPDGHMTDELVRDLAKMLGLDTARIREIPGCPWDHSGVKVDGIAWLEHVVLGREFVWVENRDGLTDRDLEVLRQVECGHRYFQCDVTRDATALQHVRPLLEGRLEEGVQARLDAVRVLSAPPPPPS